MKISEVNELLVAGGLSLADIESDALRPSRYRALKDPRGARELCSRLADRVKPDAPTRILVGEDFEDALIGYTVGQELGLSVTRVVESEGLLYVLGALEEGDRVAVLADAFRREDTLRALLRVVANNKASVAVVAALVDSRALRAVDAEGIARGTTL